MSRTHALSFRITASVLAVALGGALGAVVGRPREEVVRPAGAGADRVVVPDGLGSLPLSFEENRGQADPALRFLARGEGFTMGVTLSGPVISMAVPPDPQRVGPEIGPTGAAIAMRLSGGRPPTGIEGRGIQDAVVSYFRGSDPRRWQGDVPTFERVVSRGVYPGIDLVLRGTRTSPEYDFVVAPGADPAAIGMRFAGAEGLRVNVGGDLVVATPIGRLVQRAPTIYQERPGGRAVVEGGFVIEDGTVGFTIGPYDPERPLVIDPLVDIVYSNLLGGRRYDSGYGVAVDATGAAYVAGYTQNALVDFPATPGGFSTAHAGDYDAFVAKLDPSGSALVYSTYLGGDDYDGAYAIAVDAAGAAFVTGETYYLSVPFPTTPGAYDTTPNGDYDVFVTKLDPSGGSLAYSTLLGGGDYEYPEGLALDAAGAAYVVGQTYEDASPFPTTGGAYQTTHNGYYDAFVAKLDPSGGSLAYSTFLGGDNYENAYDVRVDGAGAAYVTGETAEGNVVDFPTTGGSYDPTRNGGYDAFVTKLDPSGGSLAYSTFLGGNNSDLGYGIAVDGGGAAYIGGYSYDGSVDFPTTGGAFDTGHNGGFDGFVTKLDPSGGSLAYSTFLGGAGGDFVQALAIDGTGGAYVTGETSEPEAGADYPTTPDAHSSARIADRDAFLTQVDPTGGSLVYSTFLGGGDRDEGFGIALDASGAAYVVGSSDDSSSPFPTTPGAFSSAYVGGTDAFVTKVGVPAVCKGKNATHTGTDGKDTIVGTDEADVVAALDGNDVVKGLDGKDVVCGGDGNDRLVGGPDPDTLLGERGKDTLKGGADNDRLVGGKQKDTCVGGDGKDRARSCEKERSIPA